MELTQGPMTDKWIMEVWSKDKRDTMQLQGMVKVIN